MLILGVDAETTGVEDSHEIIEVGAVLYDTVTQRVLSSYGRIYKVDHWTEEAYRCHHISKELCERMPSIHSELAKEYDPFDLVSGDMAEYIIAHKADHDHPKFTKIWPSFLKKPWLCSAKDLIHTDFIDRVASMRLAHLCVDYKIPTGSWHQAVADAEACARIAGLHDLHKAHERKMAPKFDLIASGGYVDGIKEPLKSAPSVLLDKRYYQWDSENRHWHKEGLLSEQIEGDAKYIKQITKGAKPQWAFELKKMDPPSY